MKKLVRHSLSHIRGTVTCTSFFIIFVIQLTEIDLHIANSGDVFTQEVVSLAREEYQALYHDEVELNETFDQFVWNYKAAYEGRNTRKDQVIDTTVLNKLPHPESCK